jgi:carbonic anhydrase
MFKKGIVVSLVLVVAVTAGFAFTPSQPASDALARLVEGNKHFVSGSMVQVDLGNTRRTELAGGQHPQAIIVTCSDSRVAPEHIFNQGLGDIFVVRVAGNVLDPVALGSVEYAAEHLHAPLLVLMGHDKCGAVSAAVDAKGEPEGNIGAVIRMIQPAVKRAKAKGGSKEEIVDNAIRENVAEAYSTVLEKSPVLKHMIEKGELKVVAGMYHLASGQVETLPMEAPAPAIATDHAHTHAH